MARFHSGGFINSEFYFNIGTESARGRDGDTARLAAQKYNDHRHSAYIADSPHDVRNWKNEVQTASTHPSSGNPGGLLEDAQQLLRLPGDLAELNTVLYAATSNSVKSITSGFGVHIDMAPAQAVIVEDYVASNFSMIRGRVPPEGIECGFANNNGYNQPFYTTIGDCVVYPTIRAGNGGLLTQVITTAGLKVSAPPRIDLPGQPNTPLSIPPRIGILLAAKRYPTVNQRIVSANVVSGPQTLITSMTGRIWAEISNSGDVGHTVSGILEFPGNFEGRIELEMSFDIDGCYTPDDYALEAGEHRISEDELKSYISTWAEQNVKLDLLDATARVFCTFKGQ